MSEREFEHFDLPIFVPLLFYIILFSIERQKYEALSEHFILTNNNNCTSTIIIKLL